MKTQGELSVACDIFITTRDNACEPPTWLITELEAMRAILVISRRVNTFLNFWGFFLAAFCFYNAALTDILYSLL